MVTDSISPENSPNPAPLHSTPETATMAVAALACPFAGTVLNKVGSAIALPLWPIFMMADLAITLLGVVLSILAIRKVNRNPQIIKGKGLAIAGLIIGGLKLTLVIVGNLILMSSDPLSDARATAARMKCSNNLAHISKAALFYTSDHDGKYPWELTDEAKTLHFGSMSESEFSVGSIFALDAMKTYLEPANLLSPCDSDRIESNQELLTSWETFSTKEGRPLPHNAISYVICAGAKENNFGAILGLTRNLSTDDLKTANWVDGTKGNHPNGMKLLNENQGQFVTTDGSARRADSLDLKEQTEAHIYRFGDDESESSTRIIR